MRFEEAYGGWKRGRMTQEEAALLLGVCDRTFRRYLARYEEEGMEGLVDQRLGQISHRRAPHEWVIGKLWDLIVTMDDATGTHYSMFFVEEEGTQSSFQGVRKVIEGYGVFASLYTDRGSHYWHTPAAGGKVDKENFTQFGCAMRQLGIEMIPAYSPDRGQGTL